MVLEIDMVVCDSQDGDLLDENAIEALSSTLDLPDGTPPLTSLYLYLVTGCNLACRHCWITPTFVRGEPVPGDCMPMEALKTAVKEAKPMGLRHAKLTGGEPLLHPQLFDVLDLLTDEGIDLDMETNGTLVDEKVVRRFRQSNLKQVSLSLDGARPETHDTFRGVKGAFEAALRGVDHLVNAGYDNLQIIMSLHRGNIEEVEDVVNVAVAHGAGSVKFNPVTASGRGAVMHERGEALDFEEVMAVTRYILGDLQDSTLIQMILGVPPALMTVRELLLKTKGSGRCHARNILGILGTGEIALCGIGRNVPELCFGKLGVDSIRKIWLAHPALLQLRRDLDDVAHFPGVCGQCIHASSCLTFCLAQNFLDSGHLIWPSSLCSEAERKGVFPKTRLK